MAASNLERYHEKLRELNALMFILQSVNTVLKEIFILTRKSSEASIDSKRTTATSSKKRVSALLVSDSTILSTGLGCLNLRSPMHKASHSLSNGRTTAKKQKQLANELRLWDCSSWFEETLCERQPNTNHQPCQLS